MYKRQTFVLPDPAFAVSHVDNLASDAAIGAFVAELVFIRFQFQIYQMYPIHHNVKFDHMESSPVLRKERAGP